jgi:hypothetical protein
MWLIRRQLKRRYAVQFFEKLDPCKLSEAAAARRSAPARLVRKVNFVGTVELTAAPSCICRSASKRGAVGLWKSQEGQECDGRRHHHQESRSNLIPGTCD